MARKQHYGIKFPITVKNEVENTYVDLNQNERDMVKSQIMHLIFTPKGQKIRDPYFGSKLIQFIFNPNDAQTWGDVVQEIKDSVKSFVPNCNIEDVSVYETDSGYGLVATIKYTVTEIDGEVYTEEIITRL